MWDPVNTTCYYPDLPTTLNCSMLFTNVRCVLRYIVSAPHLHQEEPCSFMKLCKPVCGGTKYIGIPFTLLLRITPHTQ